MIVLEDARDCHLWNSFLESEKERQLITIAHNPCLADILAMTFGYTAQNKFLRKDGDIVGVLPAVRVGNTWVSMPHFSYGGPITRKNMEHQFRLKDLLRKGKYEARSFSKLSNYYRSRKVTCIVPLTASPETQFKQIKPQMRRKIRKAVAFGFRTVHGGKELLDDFYLVFAKKMLEKGSPPLGKVFFQNLLDHYAHGEAKITAIYKDGEVAAAGFNLSYLGFNEMSWASSNKDYDAHNANSLLYWEILIDSINSGHDYFSMGRSTMDSGNHFYKKQWAPMELPLYFNYSEPVGKSLKDYEFLTKIWKLQPLETSVYFGNLISKYVY